MGWGHGRGKRPQSLQPQDPMGSPGSVHPFQGAQNTPVAPREAGRADWCGHALGLVSRCPGAHGPGPGAGLPTCSTRRPRRSAPGRCGRSPGCCRPSSPLPCLQTPWRWPGAKQTRAPMVTSSPSVARMAGAAPLAPRGQPHAPVPAGAAPAPRPEEAGEAPCCPGPTQHQGHPATCPSTCSPPCGRPWPPRSCPAGSGCCRGCRRPCPGLPDRPAASPGTGSSWGQVCLSPVPPASPHPGQRTRSRRPPRSPSQGPAPRRVALLSERQGPGPAPSPPLRRRCLHSLLHRGRGLQPDVRAIFSSQMFFF